MSFFKKPTISKILFFVLGVMLFVFSFPFSIGSSPWAIQYLSPLLILLYLSPLLWLIDQNPSYVFFKSWLFFTLGSIGALYWITISMKNYGDLSNALSLTGLLGTAISRSLFPAVALYLWSRFKTPKSFVLLGATLMTLQDFLLHFVPFGGFPWLTAAYALAPDFLWIQTLDLWGVHGLNFITHFLGFWIFAFFCGSQQVQFLSWRWVAFALVLFHAYGAVSLIQTEKLDHHDAITIGWVQGNIEQSLKWKAEEREGIIEKYKRLTLQIATQNPDLIIWPEAALPNSVFRHTQKITSLDWNQLQIPLFLGAPSHKTDDNQQIYFNSAFLIDKDAKVTHVYDKIHLVPFGEFVPTLGLDLTSKIPVLAGSFTQGKELSPMLLNDRAFGVSICYEVLYPKMFTQLTEQGASFFVNVTNDAWFDFSSGPFQHARFPIFRAIESRKSIVRVANTGMSALYLPSGRVTQKTGLFVDDTRIVTVPTNTHKTFFHRFPYVTLAFLLVFLLYSAVQWMHYRHEA